MFGAALFIIAGTWDQLTCPSTGEWAKPLVVADPCHGLSYSHARDSTAGTPGVWRGFNSSAEQTQQDRRAARTGTMLGNGQMHWVRAIRRGAIWGGGGDPAGRCTRELSKILGMFWNVMGV